MSDEYGAEESDQVVEHSAEEGKAGVHRHQTPSSKNNHNDVKIVIDGGTTTTTPVLVKHSYHSNDVIVGASSRNHSDSSSGSKVVTRTPGGSGVKSDSTAGQGERQDNGHVRCPSDRGEGNHGDGCQGNDNQPEWMKTKLRRVLTVEGDQAETNTGESGNTGRPTSLSPVTVRRASKLERQSPAPEWAHPKLRAARQTSKTAEDAPLSKEEQVEVVKSPGPGVRVATMRFEALNENEKRRSFTTDDIDALKNLTNTSPVEVKGSNNKQKTGFLRKTPKPTPKPKPKLNLNGKTSNPTTPSSNLKSTQKLTRSAHALTKDAIHPGGGDDLLNNHTGGSPSRTSGGIPRCGTDTNLTNEESGHEFLNAFSRMRQKILQKRESEKSIDDSSSHDKDRTLTRTKMCSNVTYVGSTNTGTLKSDSSITSGGSANASFSDSDSDSEFDSFSSCSDSELNSSQNLSAAQRLIQDLDDDKPRSKLYKKVYELLTTERAYVRRLNLIQMFATHITDENKKQRMFPDETIVQMFSNTESICTFHQQHVLPALESRMKEWDTNPRLGDILSRLAPFLKIYSEFVSNYDSSSKLIISTYQKCAKFKLIMDELQKLPECNHLALQHHMLEPIQRVPRYEMLVKDYLRLLPDDSDDKGPTEKALQLVMTAAMHNNETLKKMERFHQLLQIHEMLGGVLPNIVNPTRQLIKKGKLTKVSRRNGALMERYIFLFNDMLLVCSEQNIALTTTYRLHDKLSVGSMKTYNGDNPDLPNTFHVKTKEKVIEFYVNDLEESDEWQATLWRVANDYMKKKQSFNKDVNLYDCGMELYKMDDEMVGKTAPKWVRDDDASMCMVCCTLFTRIKRRHHCRACGILVCAKCSNYKHRLEYDDKIHRVCQRCYDILVATSERSHGNSVSDVCTEEPPLSPAPTTGTTGTTGTTSQTLKKKKDKKLLETKATDPSVICGYLNVSPEGRSWQKNWCAIHEDFVLYTFRGRQDIQAASSLALPGYVLKIHETSEFNLSHVFSLSHAAVGTRFFDAGDETNLTRWKKVLVSVLVAELPPEHDEQTTSPSPSPSSVTSSSDAV